MTMIGKDETNEEPVLKVTDKRKFNVDGSLREGIKIEKEEPKEDISAKVEQTSNIISEANEPLPQTHPSAQAETPNIPETKPAVETKQEEEEEEDIMDDENPSSFINFLSTLVTNAAASLGAMPHPVTGQQSVDLDTGKYWIDVLAMLQEKTDGNLSSQEEKLLKSVLGDLQMQYLALTRAAEEKLKAQAAQKFSSKDILGG